MTANDRFRAAYKEMVGSREVIDRACALARKFVPNGTPEDYEDAAQAALKHLLNLATWPRLILIHKWPEWMSSMMRTEITRWVKKRDRIAADCLNVESVAHRLVTQAAFDSESAVTEGQPNASSTRTILTDELEFRAIARDSCHRPAVLVCVRFLGEQPRERVIAWVGDTAFPLKARDGWHRAWVHSERGSPAFELRAGSRVLWKGPQQKDEVHLTAADFLVASLPEELLN